MRHANLFGIDNLEDLSFPYRLLAIEGLSPGDNLARYLNLIAKGVAYEMRQPVTRIEHEGVPCLAVPLDAELPILERPLTPHVAVLRPLDGEFTLNFGDLNRETTPIAQRLLSWTFESALHSRMDLWGDRNSYYWKHPHEQTLEVQMFQGFHFRVVPLPEGGLALCLDITHKYADAHWLTECGDLVGYKMRHCLYQFGHRWYRVQFLNPMGRSIREQKFQPNGEGSSIDVYSYTREKCNSGMPSWVRDLDPDSPAILYRSPGSENEQHGAAALSRLLFKTDAPAVRGLHRRSILPPEVRLDKIVDVARRYLGNTSLCGVPVALSTEPAEVPHHYFTVPDLVFGQGKRLHVKQEGDKAGVALPELGKARMNFLTGKGGGTYTTTPLDPQYIIMPVSWPRDVQDAFIKRLTSSVEPVLREPYRPKPVLFEDRGKRSLPDQVQAIRDALQRANVRSGYAVLVLPDNADPSLHNYVKREFWPKLQFQCARAGSVQRFFVQSEVQGQTQWTVLPRAESGFASYLRYLALGMLLVNRKWPFMLAEPTNYDLYIGIDVLNNAAGFTFFYAREGRCHFHHETSQQKEKLSKDQVEKIVYEQVKLLLQGCRQVPASVVFLRDGISHESERKGAYAALKRLQKEGLLGNDLKAGTVEVHKQSSIPLRLFDTGRRTSDPRMGDYYVLSEREGFICTTGSPFSGPGTAHPLQLKVVGKRKAAENSLNIEWIMQDVFAQAVLAWSAPDRPSRLPVAISLCDLYLQPIASKIGEDTAEEENTPEEDDEADWA